MKTNKLYLITTKKFCAGVVVDSNDNIIDCAPCFYWTKRKKIKFTNFKTFLVKHNDLLKVQCAE